MFYNLKNAAILELTGASNDIVELRGGSYLLVVSKPRECGGQRPKTTERKI